MFWRNAAVLVQTRLKIFLSDIISSPINEDLEGESMLEVKIIQSAASTGKESFHNNSDDNPIRVINNSKTRDALNKCCCAVKKS